MICFQCRMKVDEGAKFCKYCGQELYQGNIEIKECQEIHKVERTDGSSRYSLTVIAIALLIVIIGVGYVYLNFNVCDWCDKKYVGDAYYDAWNSDVIMCEDCAKSYYRGVNYAQFKIQ